MIDDRPVDRHNAARRRDLADPLGDYADTDGVLHRFDHDRPDGDWYHADPRHAWCRDRSCSGNPTGPTLVLMTSSTVTSLGTTVHKRLDLQLLLHPALTNDDVQRVQRVILDTVLTLNLHMHVERELAAERRPVSTAYEENR